MQSTYSLPGELTIYTVGDLHHQYLAWIVIDSSPGAKPGLKVDAQAVLEVDAAGVQLLLSLSIALASQQRALYLIRPSAPLVAACNALGVSCLTAQADPT